MEVHHHLWRELEELGEDTARQRYAAGVYGPAKAPHVRAWLEMKDAQARERDERELRRETIRVAQQGNTVAWFAAIASLVIGLGSILVALMH